MTAGRLFAGSLVLAILCVAGFAFWTPGLTRGAELSFDRRIGGYGLKEAETYLRWLAVNKLTVTYLGAFRWIDSVFPLAVFGLLASGVWGLWARPARMVALLGCGLAVVYLGADYVENARVAGLLRAGPDALTASQVSSASLATQVKWIGIFAPSLLILAGLLLTAIKGGRQ